jgi:hypothetical protein
MRNPIRYFNSLPEIVRLAVMMYIRHPVPGSQALKFAIEDALPGGVYAAPHVGLYRQMAAIWVLFDLELY